MNKDLYNIVLERSAFAPVAIASDTATFGNVIDTQGFESIFFTTTVGVVTTGDITMAILECTTTGGTYTAVDSSMLIGAYATLDTTADINSVGAVTKRFAKVKLTSDNSAALLVASTAILGHSLNASVR